MFTLAFWKATAERALKTLAQSLIAVLGGVYAFDEINWHNTLNAVGIATALSVLTSVASSQFGGPGPSLTDSEKLSPQPPAEPVNEGGAFDAGILITIAAIVVIICGVIFIAQAL